VLKGQRIIVNQKIDHGLVVRAQIGPSFDQPIALPGAADDAATLL
jgi:hypothetical protein